MEFYERVSGARLHAELFPARRRAAGYAGRARGRHHAWCDSSRQRVDDLEQLLTENRIFKQRTVDIGVDLGRAGARLGLLRPDAARLGRAVGSAQGAALRRLRPDRFRHPGRQERRLLGPLSGAHRGDAPERQDHAQASTRCRPGPVKVNDRKVAPPPRGEMKRSMEALIHHFKLYTEGYHVPPGETYTVVEAPKGEFGVYLVADGTNRPYRCKIRAPGFAFLQAIGFMGSGHMLADMVAIIGSHGHRLRRDRPMSDTARTRRSTAGELRLHAESRKAKPVYREISAGPAGQRGAAAALSRAAQQHGRLGAARGDG